MLLALLGSSVLAQTPSLPEGFVADVVVSGLSVPVDLAFASDGRVFVAEKSGLVRVVSDGALQPEPFVDLRDQVNDAGDRGLVGLALHPRFPEVPYVYLAFAYDPPELRGETGDAGPDGFGARASRLIRVTADGAFGHSRALDGSEVVLLGANSTLGHLGDPSQRNPQEPSCWAAGEYVQDCLPADEISHTIGRVRFGPDGALYVGVGDGTDYQTPRPYHVRPQHLDSLAGKLLRIHPLTGEGLADNPFFDGDPSSNRSKVLSFGLRNPYSFTFHPDTWEPVIADVGSWAWETIKIGAGRNFGWPCFEGGSRDLIPQRDFSDDPECQALYLEAPGVVTEPAYGYNREGTGGSIMLGGFSTGSSLPEVYRDALFFADHYQGWIRTLRLDARGAPIEAQAFATVNFPVGVEFGPDGQLYYLNIWGGELVRLRYAWAEAQPPAPVIVARVTPRSGPSPVLVQFDASLSSDPGGGPLSYSWAFAADLSSPFPSTSWLFFDGDHPVRLTVTNESGISSSEEFLLRFGGEAPQAVILEPLHGTVYEPGDVVHYRGRGLEADGTTIPDDRLRWQLLIHYDDHVDPSGLPRGAAGREGAIFAAHRGERALELCLTVVARDGSEDTSCTELRLR